MKKEIRNLFFLFVILFVFVFVITFYNPVVLFTPPGYSPNYDVFNNNQQIFFIQGNFPNLQISVNHGGAYVYKYGYYWSESQYNWIQFTLNHAYAPAPPGSDWIPEQADLTLNLSSETFASDIAYIVTYTCKKHSGVWKCGCASQTDCNHWMLYEFNITTGGDDDDGNDYQGTFATDLEITQGGKQIAGFSQDGNITLLGECMKKTNPAPEGSFEFINDEEETVAYLDTQGNLYINNADCEPKEDCDQYQPTYGYIFKLINEQGKIVVSIDQRGDLCYTGELSKGLFSDEAGGNI